MKLEVIAEPRDLCEGLEIIDWDFEVTYQYLQLLSAKPSCGQYDRRLLYSGVEPWKEILPKTPTVCKYRTIWRNSVWC